MILKYPVKNKEISQEFGRDASNDPEYKEFYKLFDNKHPGVDFELEIGTDVSASFDGIVVRVEDHLGMGNVIGVRNGNIVGLYAHLSQINVSLGQIVTAGDVIGLSGETGKACTSPHLHFELRDLTRPSLKEMVFEPVFEKEIVQFKPYFSYKVNNRNTLKTLKSLSVTYFGTEIYWSKIKEVNNFEYKPDDILIDGMEVLISNFEE